MTASRLAALFACLLALSSLTSAARADALADASKLRQQGQPGQALQRIEQFLAVKPADAQGLFLKGVILADLGKSEDAVALFTRLTEDYPELPEPYNNLAVIFAARQQYDKARQYLELALRANPAYATAQENLGDVYARLAGQSYEQALQIDAAAGAARTKLALLRQVLSLPAPGAAPH